MRDGRILCEGHPDELMRATQRDNLEDVFLALCHSQHATNEDGNLEAEDGEGAGDKASNKETPRDPHSLPEFQAILAQQNAKNSDSGSGKKERLSIHSRSEVGFVSLCFLLSPSCFHYLSSTCCFVNLLQFKRWWQRRWQRLSERALEERACADLARLQTHASQLVLPALHFPRARPASGALLRGHRPAAQGHPPRRRQPGSRYVFENGHVRNLT